MHNNPYSTTTHQLTHFNSCATIGFNSVEARAKLAHRRTGNIGNARSRDEMPPWGQGVLMRVSGTIALKHHGLTGAPEASSIMGSGHVRQPQTIAESRR
jgi:hypothetical protein